MRLSNIKQHLSHLKTMGFQLPDGAMVPRHFHVTEVGKITKHFIDCGGTVRKEEVVSFQLWEAHDYDHRLHPEKLIRIIEHSEKILDLPDAEIEVAYQGNTIGTYGLDFDGRNFLLTPKHTDCLARDACRVPEKPKVKLSDPGNEPCCAPDGNCC